MELGSTTPTRLQVRERLARLLGEIAKIPGELIVDGATFDEDLRIESVAFVELHVAIEEAYDAEIDPLRVIELNEFGAIANYIYECARAAAQ